MVWRRGRREEEEEEECMSLDIVWVRDLEMELKYSGLSDFCPARHRAHTACLLQVKHAALQPGSPGCSAAGAATCQGCSSCLRALSIRCVHQHCVLVFLIRAHLSPAALKVLSGAGRDTGVCWGGSGCVALLLTPGVPHKVLLFLASMSEQMCSTQVHGRALQCSVAVAHMGPAVAPQGCALHHSGGLRVSNPKP